MLGGGWHFPVDSKPGDTRKNNNDIWYDSRLACLILFFLFISFSERRYHRSVYNRLIMHTLHIYIKGNQPIHPLLNVCWGLILSHFVHSTSLLVQQVKGNIKISFVLLFVYFFCQLLPEPNLCTCWLGSTHKTHSIKQTLEMTLSIRVKV